MESIILEFINFLLGKNIYAVYIMFFISSFLQVVFPPHPGDVILVFQGYLTSISDAFGFIPVLLNALSATLLGCFVIYKFGYNKGQKVFEYKLINKYITSKHQEKCKAMFEKYGYFTIFISKFIPGINIVTILFAGIFKVNSRVVYSSVLASVVLHHVVYLLLGRFLGYNMKYIKHIITTYNSIVIACVIILILGYIAYQFVISKGIKREKV